MLSFAVMFGVGVVCGGVLTYAFIWWGLGVLARARVDGSGS